MQVQYIMVQDLTVSKVLICKPSPDICKPSPKGDGLHISGHGFVIFENKCYSFGFEGGNGI